MATNPLRPLDALINFRFPNFSILQMKNNAMALQQTFNPAFIFLFINFLWSMISECGFHIL